MTKENARYVVSVSNLSIYEQEDSVEELKELARFQRSYCPRFSSSNEPKVMNPSYLMGEGKFKELIINALNKGATLLDI